MSYVKITLLNFYLSFSGSLSVFSTHQDIRHLSISVFSIHKFRKYNTSFVDKFQTKESLLISVYTFQ